MGQVVGDNGAFFTQPLADGLDDVGMALGGERELVRGFHSVWCVKCSK